jgi:hypothetical protein
MLKKQTSRYDLTPWSRVLYEKLIVARFSNKFSFLGKPKFDYLVSALNHTLTPYFSFKILVKSILVSTPRTSKWLLAFMFFN